MLFVSAQGAREEEREGSLGVIRSCRGGPLEDIRRLVGLAGLREGPGGERMPSVE